MSGRNRSRIAAAGLSCLLPGLGQWFTGQPAQGLALICIDLGIGVNFLLSSSAIGRGLLALVYFSVAITAAIDAYRAAGPDAGQSRAGSVPYVVLMLFIVGPFAIPMLWASPGFSRRAKIIWTVVVIAVALLFIVTVGYLSEFLEYLLSYSGAGV
jgi:hypothetical protein